MIHKYLVGLIGLPAGLCVCEDCGCVVYDRAIHNQFHLDLRNASHNAALANERLDDLE